MIPADIGAVLERILAASVASGELPGQAASRTAAGTWRPAPHHAGGGPGTYATSLPLTLARQAGLDPGAVAALFADGLAGVPWISRGQVTGAGYLTISVTSAHLAGLAARIIAAGPAAAASTALAGSHLTATRLPDLTEAASWLQAWQQQHVALTGRLTRAAGGQVLFQGPERNSLPASTSRTSRAPVAVAVAYHGADAVCYALARTATADQEAIERQLAARLDLDNPFVAVRFAHADAASTLRWAADLGLSAVDVWPADAPVPQPPELALLDAISWLPERVAAAARRHRPAELTAHLEYLAAAWLDCRESCPVLPFQGHAAPARRSWPGPVCSGSRPPTRCASLACR